MEYRFLINAKYIIFIIINYECFENNLLRIFINVIRIINNDPIGIVKYTIPNNKLLSLFIAFLFLYC